MFISTLDIFKIGIGPSSSHTMGPMVAARAFMAQVGSRLAKQAIDTAHVRCTLRGSLAFTGRGHATDRAVLLGLHDYTPESASAEDIDELVGKLTATPRIATDGADSVAFAFDRDIIFDRGPALPEHPNGMIFELLDDSGQVVMSQTYFSIGGGFISTPEELKSLAAPMRTESMDDCPFPFDSARTMLEMAEQSGLSIAAMKRANELTRMSETELDDGLDLIWDAMRTCIERGLEAEGTLPGGLDIKRRAHDLRRQLLDDPANATVNDWLCAYAMAVNEENAAGHLVVTAPTNGAAGVLPAVLFHYFSHHDGTLDQIRDFLLTAASIGGLIKHRGSFSGAEVGCQGEVGSAAAMAAAGLCAVKGGDAQKIENAAEIALEHHLGMTCDPVGGLVQVPCIERNGFGAIKAWTASSLACRGTGQHFMPLDACIAAMQQTGKEMSHKYKETSLGGLAVSITEC